MGVKSVDHQERGLPRVTRDGPAPDALPGEDAVAELARLRRAIARARDLQIDPYEKHNHCGHCWGRGRDAAIRTITEES